MIEALKEGQRKGSDASEEVADNEGHHIQGDSLLRRSRSFDASGKTMTEEEILGQMLLLFVAGFDTSASLLTSCTYCLALNPEAQQLLWEEITGAVDEKGDIDYQKMAQLPYLDAVLSETLRMYSPFIRLERLASADYRLDKTGLVIPKGMVVQIPTHAIHYNPQFHPQPEVFRPERFLPQNRDKMVPYSYLPFGGGPRYCVGMRFALLEAKTALVHLLQRFKIGTCSRTKCPPEYVVGRGLLLIKDAVLRFDSR
jgi:cytochrome P450